MSYIKAFALVASAAFYMVAITPPQPRVVGDAVFFTFEVIIKDDHKLITSGPYSYVRHPSYTGILCLTTGAYLMHFGAGGYVAAKSTGARSRPGVENLMKESVDVGVFRPTASGSGSA
ncbi:hypothetical protein V8D89_014541 [Ganoderma adspersum]